MTQSTLVFCRWPGCPESTRPTTFEDQVLHMLDHLRRDLITVTDSVTQLDANVTGLEGSVDTLGADVKDLATENAVFLGDILNDLAKLGNNDQVNAIAQRVAAKKAALDTMAAQVTQLTTDEVAEDTQVSTPVVPPVEPVVSDGSASAGETEDVPASTV